MTRRLVLLTLLVAGTALAIGRASNEHPLPPRVPLAEVPLAIGDWQAAAHHEFDANTLAVLRADDYVARAYVRGGEQVDAFVGYYASQRQGASIHSPMNCLPAAGWQPLSSSRLSIDAGQSGVIDASRYVIQKGLNRQLVVYWYQSHGRTIASEYASKFYLVLDSIRLRRSDGALVRVIAPLGRDEAAAERSVTAFVRALTPTLARHLPS
jgi:EpsI family protein